MKIISGGQTGVDRAALDAAIARGLPWGGWCPKGGWAEDFPHPPGVLDKYPHLKETPSAHPLQRTEWNVRDSDAALIVIDQHGLSASIGTQRGHQWAHQHGKPEFIADTDDPQALTHAAIYRSDPDVACVLHVHDPDTWRRAEELALPVTASGIEYGTVAMADAVSRLLKSQSARPLVFATLGHEDGVFGIGATPDAVACALVRSLGTALERR